MFVSYATPPRPPRPPLKMRKCGLCPAVAPTQVSVPHVRVSSTSTDDKKKVYLSRTRLSAVQPPVTQYDLKTARMPCSTALLQLTLAGALHRLTSASS